MLAGILKTTLRSLYRDRLYSLINVLGLSLGFCCFLLIFLYLRHELTYDQHFDRHENIYRLNTEMTINGASRTSARAGMLAPVLLARDYPEFAEFVRFQPATQNNDPTLFIRGESAYYWEDLYNADNKVFDVFSHEILYGDPATALTQPRSLAVSASFARTYFGTENPVGQTIGVQLPTNEYRITLVFDDLPDNTSLKYDVLFSYSNPPALETGPMFQLLTYFSDHVYLLLPEDYDPSSFGAVSEEFFARYGAEGARDLFPGQEIRLDHHLQPLDEIRLTTGLQDDLPSGNRFYIGALGSIAVFILFIAGINYMNLATARSRNRAREAGVRRTLGAHRSLLALQFLAEGMIFAFLALAIGLAMTEFLLSLDLVDAFLGRRLNLSLAGDWVLILQLAAAALLLGLLSGSYPALYYSSVRPADAFKARDGTVNRKGLSLRAVLVGVQMLLSIAVIAGAFLMQAQVDFLQNRPLGFEQENKLIFRTVMRVSGNDEFRTFLDGLKRLPGVIDAGMSDVIPGTTAYTLDAVLEAGEGRKENLQVHSNVIDESLLSTLGIKILEGRNLSYPTAPSNELESKSYLVNETLVREMGWKEAVGMEIQFPSSLRRGRVVGVVEDFNFADLRETITPLVLEPYYPDSRWIRYVILDLSPAGLSDTLRRVEAVFKEFMPSNPFEYDWLDQSLDALYGAERNQARLVSAFSVVCILIAILGLAGLAAFTVEQRSKEIGIRKVLGASSARIILMLFKPLFVLVLLAALAASCIAWLAIDHWLRGFAYRIDVDPIVFIAAGAIVMLTAFLALSGQAWRIARENPVKSLRYE